VDPQRFGEIGKALAAIVKKLGQIAHGRTSCTTHNRRQGLTLHNPLTTCRVRIGTVALWAKER
jgi:hypothetical protein